MLIIGATDPVAVDRQFDAHQGGLAFDIGANCGQSVRRLLPNFERVVAVEPAGESFAILRETYGTDGRVVLINAACTAQSGPVTLDVRDVIGSGQLTTGQPGELPWGEAHGTREVAGLTVDQLTEAHGQPDLLKVDTEGHEAEVLRGATETLKARPHVIIEVHSQGNGIACRQLLAGYDLELIPHTAYRPLTWGTVNHYWLVA